MKELKNVGVAVIDNFITAELCENYRQHIDELIESNPKHVTSRSDERIYGVERISDLFKEYAEDPFFRS